MAERLSYQEYSSGWGTGPTLKTRPVSVCGIVHHGALAHPGKTAVTFFGRDLTYREIDEMAERFAAALGRLGVKEGDRVAALLPNCPQHLIALLAGNRLGAIHVAVGMLSQGEELRGILSDSGARTVIVLDLFYDNVMAIVDKTAVREVIVAGMDDFFPPAMSAQHRANARLDQIRAAIPYGGRVHGFTDLLKENAEVVAAPASFDSDDPLMILYTTGSASRNKRVVTQRELLHNAANLWQTLVLRVSVWFSSRCFRQGGISWAHSVDLMSVEMQLPSFAVMPVAC